MSLERKNIWFTHIFFSRHFFATNLRIFKWRISNCGCEKKHMCQVCSCLATGQTLFTFKLLNWSTFSEVTFSWFCWKETFLSNYKKSCVDIIHDPSQFKCFLAWLTLLRESTGKITSGGRLNSKHSSKTLRSIKKTNSIFPYMLFRSFPANVFKWPKLSLHSKRFCCLIWNSQSIWKALNHSQLQFTYLSERLDLSA